jgi:type VI protein secretion system component VasF
MTLATKACGLFQGEVQQLQQMEEGVESVLTGNEKYSSEKSRCVKICMMKYKCIIVFTILLTVFVYSMFSLVLEAKNAGLIMQVLEKLSGRRQERNDVGGDDESSDESSSDDSGINDFD